MREKNGFFLVKRQKDMTKMEMAVREQKGKNDFHGMTSDIYICVCVCQCMYVVFSTRQKIDTIKASFKLSHNDSFAK